MAVIVVHSSPDGYLIGAAENNPASRSYSFWHPTGDCEFESCSLTQWEVDDLAELFTVQGTSDQYYSDGYEAMGYLHKLGQKVSD